MQTRGFPSAEAAFKERVANGEIRTDSHFTQGDLQAIVRQIQALEPEGAHDNDGLDPDGEEPDEALEYDAFRLSLQAEEDVGTIMDQLHGIHVDRANARSRVQPPNPDLLPVVGPGAVSAFVRMSDDAFAANKASMNAAQRAIFEGVKVRCPPLALMSNHVACVL
jgi:hypothetical protein